MSPDTLLWLLQAVGAGFCAVLWGMIRDMKQHNEKNKEELSSYKVHVAEKYVTSISLEKSLETVIKSIEALFVKLDKIDDKLDKKEDKKE